MTFYDVKTRASIDIHSHLTKVIYHPKHSGGTKRYAVRALHEGRHLTRFVSKTEWDGLGVRVEEA